MKGTVIRMSDNKMNLDEIRAKIDEKDNELLEVFLERMKLAAEVAKYKQENDLPILNKTRERDILASVAAKSGDLGLYAHRFFSSAIEISKAYQGELLAHSSDLIKLIEDSKLPGDTVFPKSGTVACQGVEGAYAQAVADKIFPRGTLMYFNTFEAIFNAVENGLCQYGILPIENSSNGSVREVYELLSEKDVYIIKNEKICVRHELLAKPGTKLSDITEIYSHEQAIGQCRRFLKEIGSNVKVIPVANTAMAAKMVSEADGNHVASISSHECGILYGLEPISTKIQDSENNYTRFICISKTPQIYPGANKISLILTTAHKPGALYEVLAKISALEINLIKLESCPIPGHDFEFIFFIDLEASVNDTGVTSMLAELQSSCDMFKYLGNYS